jgi:hypothetical protein
MIQEVIALAEGIFGGAGGGWVPRTPISQRRKVRSPPRYPRPRISASRMGYWSFPSVQRASRHGLCESSMLLRPGFALTRS